MNDFVNNWSKIFIDAALSFSTVVKEVSSFMYEPVSVVVGDANVSAEITPNDLPNLTYEECFRKFMINELELPTKEVLGSFIDNNKHMKAIKKGEETD